MHLSVFIFKYFKSIVIFIAIYLFLLFFSPLSVGFALLFPLLGVEGQVRGSFIW